MADITVPQLGETVTEGTITQWFKNVGDSVGEDEPLFEVSTDKVDTEVPSPVSGVLTEIRVDEGDTVDVGTVIAVVGGSDDALATAPAPGAAPLPPSDPAQVPTPLAETAPSPPTARGGDNRLLSPVVRRLVNEHGLDVESIRGTGPGGRITRVDVLNHIDAAGSAPHQSATGDAALAAALAPVPTAAPAAPTAFDVVSAPPAPAPAVTAGERDRSVRLSKIRRLTGDHMIMSKATSPHAFSVVEVDFANVDLIRKDVRKNWKAQHGFSLTYLPFIARAVIDGLREFPHLNASVGTNELVVHNHIDLGIAVDLDYEGLLAPVLRDADTKRLAAIAQQIHHAADRARNRKLGPDEISGGTFTLSNNGSAGSALTMPIINQPQVGIISTDAIVRRPVVVTGLDGDEAIAIHPVGNLAMSWDHRAFDGAYAAAFLTRVKEILESKDWSTEL
jgi:pyruvate dehydrogenase E2 component (dihydrolipoamide acetyltransferase)